MSQHAVAKRYAKALVQLAVEEGALERFQSELQRFAEVLAGHAELTSFLANPGVRGDAKKGALGELLHRLGLTGTMANFLMFLLERKRLDVLPQIIQSYGTQADELSGVVRPVLVSAAPLEEAQVAGIRDALVKMTGKKVMLKVEVDSSLIGGVVTEFGGKLFDGSVKTQLQRIEQILQKG